MSAAGETTSSINWCPAESTTRMIRSSNGLKVTVLFPPSVAISATEVPWRGRIVRTSPAISRAWVKS